ncbi:hypothetical protein YC2023_049595 [Brassica napus]
MTTDEPSLTRWSFLVSPDDSEFKTFYDAKFGRKKLPEEPQESKPEDDGSSSNKEEDASQVATNPAQMTQKVLDFVMILQEGNTSLANGIREKPKPKKSMFPPFESAETRALAESLSRQVIVDIIRGNPNVKWESIKGLENAKRLLKEAVVMPIKYPSYFNGLLSPWKGILLFGPPGTGKVWNDSISNTMLAKAVATECNTTFFNISASSVVSKWRGDSEKLIRVLFDLARHHAPATIFLDEIDAIISQRGGEGRSEHEASRRLKTELLIQMDGLQKTNELVFVLAATNLPWELDAAMLRRLEKRILVPLPDPEARRGMFEMLLPSQPGDEPLPHDVLVEKSEGYSGSDIRILCKEAAMQPLRRTLASLEDTEEIVPEDELPKVGPILPEDIDRALSNTRPSAHLHAHLYDKFNDDYGSQILK